MHHKHMPYPFTAIVGQERMKLALLLNAVDWLVGGVLIRGEKGTAKSTAARALAEMLPEIEVVADCPFGCHPRELGQMCNACQQRAEGGEDLPVLRRKMRVVDLPINATEDRVVGTLDIEKALREGIRALEPGILAEANRGVLYIDEVNLLDDHIADLLLDAAAMGRNMVEREGISLWHPARFILVGTMNPEEGELRPQLIDRFGLSVRVDRVDDISLRKTIVEHREAFDRDPWAFAETFREEQDDLAAKVGSARQRIGDVEIPDELLTGLIGVCVELGVDGHRADIVTVKAAKTIAAMQGRQQVIEDDIRRALELTLEHRMRRQPFERPELDLERIEQLLQQPHDDQPDEAEQQKKKDRSATAEREDVFEIGAPVGADRLVLARPDRLQRNAHGRNLPTLTRSRQGKYIKARMPEGRIRDVAIDATFRAAALAGREGPALPVRIEDVREKVRVGHASTLFVFVVDASGSMGVARRMASAKGAVLSLLHRAYEKKDRVAFIAFRKDRAEILLPPTRSVERATRTLRDLPTGGKTPLPAGIWKGIEVIRSELVKNRSTIPILVLITDGRGNVPIRDDVFADLASCAEEIRRRQLCAVVIDAERGRPRLGLARRFAGDCNAGYHLLDELTPDRIADMAGREALQAHGAWERQGA